jgi:hypothetical protein
MRFFTILFLLGSLLCVPPLAMTAAAQSLTYDWSRSYGDAS